MCNAWNHHASCTCGWGGHGHLGRKSTSQGTTRFSSNEFWWVPPIARNYESYVNPNATCPICGAQVYFYQSPYGGRVFFDELGYPWPKHPCTDNSSIPGKIAKTTTTRGSNSATIYSWQNTGWQPFFVSIISRFDKFLIKIVGIRDDEELILYAKSILSRHGRVRDFSIDCIAQVRKHESSCYELSIVGMQGSSITFKAYPSQIDARRGNGRRDVKWLFTTSKTNSKTNAKKNVTADLNSNDSPDITKGTLAIAYEKALSKKTNKP